MGKLLQNMLPMVQNRGLFQCGCISVMMVQQRIGKAVRMIHQYASYQQIIIIQNMEIDIYGNILPHLLNGICLFDLIIMGPEL